MHLSASDGTLRWGGAGVGEDVRCATVSASTTRLLLVGCPHLSSASVIVSRSTSFSRTLDSFLSFSSSSSSSVWWGGAGDGVPVGEASDKRRVDACKNDPEEDEEWEGEEERKGGIAVSANGGKTSMAKGTISAAARSADK